MELKWLYIDLGGTMKRQETTDSKIPVTRNVDEGYVDSRGREARRSHHRPVREAAATAEVNETLRRQVVRRMSVTSPFTHSIEAPDARCAASNAWPAAHSLVPNVVVPLQPNQEASRHV